MAGSTPYDIWELPFQGLPSAARPDLRKSPLRVIRGAQPLILILKQGYLRGGQPLRPFFGSFLSAQKGTPRRGGERRLRHQKTSSRNRTLRQPERAPARSLRYSPKHPTGMFWMGSPCGALAPARRAFQLQTAAAVCHQKTRRPSSRVPPSVQGGRLSSFFFYRKKKEAKKKAPFGKNSAFCGRRPGLCPWTPPPFEKGGRKLYRPSALLA